MAKILTRCPVCEAALHVSELSCGRCRTRIGSDFETCRFCRLAPEHLSFVELFLRSEGNLSRVGAELNLSYPTVRNKLANALAALGFDENEAEQAEETSNAASGAAAKERSPFDMSPEALERRRLLLESLAEGTISAEEAALALRDLNI